MNHFHLIAKNLPVDELRMQIARQPWLWDQHTMRKTLPGTPHRDMSDIWLRYNAWENFKPEDPCAFGEPHESVWYPAFYALPAVRPLIFDLMAHVQGERLGGVLITKVPPGGKIDAHVDGGWHVDYYSSKYYIQIEGAEGQQFWAEPAQGKRETISPMPGDLWKFDNRVLHGVDNRSNSDRMTLIVCIKRDERAVA